MTYRGDSRTGQTSGLPVTQGLKQVDIDVSKMRAGELRELANDVSEAARNKIPSATDCLGHSVIAVNDLNNRLQILLLKCKPCGPVGKNFVQVVKQILN